jgi:predicted small metal-binding protein
MADNINELKRRTEQAGTRDNESTHTFRCADMGNTDCTWETSLRDEGDLWPEIDRHASDAHGGPFDRGKVLDAIRRRRAA